MDAPAPEKLTETKATEAGLDQIVANVKQLLRDAHVKLNVSVSATENAEVDTAKLTHVPKSGVPLYFTAKVPGESNVCIGICEGAVMSDSSRGQINNSQKKRLYKSKKSGST